VQVDGGALLCAPCSTMYPIVDGLPILLCYATPMHATFAERHASALASLPAFRLPDGAPAAGEEAVMRSFSKEWLDYDYDGVIWEMNYEDHERRFLEEMGPALRSDPPPRFLEVGCGLGITTFLALKNGAADAVGLDLSLAVWKASRHYHENPFLHFVQASAFALPFRKASYEVVYSRGVLHHTYSTERAFASIAPVCRPGGTL
jgi:ubiquinone/menaquinone biosynthesis C-methylase UbiE